jgi:FkbM family methyltransferase
MKHAGIYHRLQASPVYDFYWRFADKSVLDRRRKEADFYRSFLGGFHQGDLIFDVGANVGDKTSTFLKLGARVVAIEPDDLNQAILNEKFLKYPFAPKRVTVVSKGVSCRSAVETMWVNEPGSAMNTFSEKWAEALEHDDQRFGCRLEFAKGKAIEVTTLEELMVTHGVPFFVKIDVEGYKINVLRGLQRPVPYLSFEVNLPEFRPEGLQCIEILDHLAADGTFNFTADGKEGLCSERWLDRAEFSRIFEHCAEKTIEVFWKTRLSGRRGRD